MAATASQKTTGAPASRGPLPLTRGRVAALVVGVPIALFAIANTGFSMLTPFAGGQYAVNYAAPPSTRSVTVSADGGQLYVKPTTAGRVTLNGTAHYSFIRSSFTTQTTGGDTAMKYHCATLPSSDCELDGTISVPDGRPVNVTTNGGNVSVSAITTAVSLRSDGGDLSADHVTGPLNLRTTGGNIRLNAIPAPQVTVSTLGGDVDAYNLSSPTVTIRTTGGNIHAADVTSQQFTATTEGGDIQIVFTTPPASVHVEATGGNITLLLPPGSTQYNVSTQTTGGNVTDTLSRNPASTAHIITATTDGGDITLASQQ